MPARAKTMMNVGPIGFNVELHKATQDEKVKLDSLCACGTRPVAGVIVPGVPGVPGTAEKVAIMCPGPECKKTYPSWATVPKRGYPSGAKDGRYLLVLDAEEIKRMQESQAKHESFVVEKVVSLQALLTHYAFDGAYFLLPSKDAVGFERVSYVSFVQELATKGRALLSRLTIGKGTDRYALVPDAQRGLLFAHLLADLRPLPYDIPGATPNDLTRKSISAILDAAFSEDATFPSEDSALVSLLDQRIQAQALAATKPKE